MVKINDKVRVRCRTEVMNEHKNGTCSDYFGYGKYFRYIKSNGSSITLKFSEDRTTTVEPTSIRTVIKDK